MGRSKSKIRSTLSGEDIIEGRTPKHDKKKRLQMQKLMKDLTMGFSFGGSSSSAPGSNEGDGTLNLSAFLTAKKPSTPRKGERSRPKTGKARLKLNRRKALAEEQNAKLHARQSKLNAKGERVRGRAKNSSDGAHAVDTSTLKPKSL